jgi:hypothetical protein
LDTKNSDLLDKYPDWGNLRNAESEILN